MSYFWSSPYQFARRSIVASKESYQSDLAPLSSPVSFVLKRCGFNRRLCSVLNTESFYRERYIQASKEHEQLRKKLQSQAEQEIEQLTNQKRLLERKVKTTQERFCFVAHLPFAWLERSLTAHLSRCNWPVLGVQVRNDKRRGGEKKRGRLGTGRVKTRLDCQPLFGNMSPRSTPQTLLWKERRLYARERRKSSLRKDQTFLVVSHCFFRAVCSFAPFYNQTPGTSFGAINSYTTYGVLTLFPDAIAG